MTRRVVVTGIGVTSAFGVGRTSLVAGLESGEPRLTPPPGLLAEVPPGLGGQLDLPRKQYRNYFDPRVLRMSTMTRQTTLGCGACGDLLRDAGCPAEPAEHPDKGAYLGSFIVPPAFKKQFVAMKLLSHRPDGEEAGWVLDDTKLDQAMKKASAFDFLRALPNMPSSHLSIQLGYQGPACTYLGSDSSGMQAIAMAVGAILTGSADAMVAGGAFDPFQEVHLSWQQQRGLWSGDQRVLPFGEGRTGTLPGEGSALLYLEELEHAKARGATILAEVLGYGQRFVTPGADDEVEVRADALRAALPEGSPDWIGPLGLGHPHLDLLEAQAYARAFGDPLEQAGVVTATAQVGFTGPATGPINLAGALLSALGECSPRRGIDGWIDGDCQPLGGGLERNGRTGDGAVVVGSSFSLDGVHCAVALRVGTP